ncbi:hypothetical protein VNO77_37757 [Canavalia gladiata]|uniref:Uncharacterized protein n=1 Tax=Canavalia gladiata TaxID=3824 RepID=A0AAN9K950_CANGL
MGGEEKGQHGQMRSTVSLRPPGERLAVHDGLKSLKSGHHCFPRSWSGYFIALGVANAYTVNGEPGIPVVKGQSKSRIGYKRRRIQGMNEGARAHARRDLRESNAPMH